MNAYDFTKGLDFAALVDASAADHNNLIDQATPYTDSGEEGKGLVLCSIDSALDTPRVPDVTVTSKWRKYLWVRVPFPGASVKSCRVYAWNDDLIEVAPLLKWKEITVDLSDVQASIDGLQADIYVIQTDVATAITASTGAVSVANNASVDAAAAVTAANTAATNAAQAINDANDAEVSASEAKSAADAAMIAAAGAQSMANAANFNAASVSPSKFFSSGEYSIATKNIADDPHGLGLSIAPKWARWVLVCTSITGDAGYSQFDEIDIHNVTTTDREQAFSGGANKDNVFLKSLTATTYRVVDKFTNNISPIDVTKWAAKCYVWA